MKYDTIRDWEDYKIVARIGINEVILKLMVIALRFVTYGFRVYKNQETQYLFLFHWRILSGGDCLKLVLYPLIFVGAVGIGAYAYYDTAQVGKNAIDLFSKEIVVEE